LMVVFYPRSNYPCCFEINFCVRNTISQIEEY
jgi:hypothetical protein